jgi:hypothetical protein
LSTLRTTSATISGIIPPVARGRHGNQQINKIKRTASPSLDERLPAFASIFSAVLSTARISAAFAYGVSGAASLHGESSL